MDLNHEKEQPMLLSHLVQAIILETPCSRIPKLQENVVQHHHA
jgi:hypothetical protein